MFLQHALYFNVVNHQNSHFYERQGIIQRNFAAKVDQSVNMTKIFKAN